MSTASDSVLSRWRWRWLIALASAIYLWATVHAAWVLTPTVDEFAHVPAGCAHWKYGRFDFYRNNPPLLKMWLSAPLVAFRNLQIPQPGDDSTGWAPWQYGVAFMRANESDYLSLMFFARLSAIGFGLATALLVYAWSREFASEFGAAIGSALWLLSPTLLAHGSLATMDSASALTCFFAAFALRWALVGVSEASRSTAMRMAIAGAALGLALATKFTAFFLIPAAVVVTWVWRRALASTATTSWLPRVRGFPWRAWLLDLTAYFATAIFVVHLSMGFSGSLQRIGDIGFASKRLNFVAQRLPRWLPAPAPREYLRGVDELIFEVEQGYFEGYLHGEWSGRGWKRYYPIAFSIKELAPFVALAALAPIGWQRRQPAGRESIALLAPLATFLVIVVFLNSLCLGVRYLLPAYPFVCVMIAVMVDGLERRWPRATHVLGSLIVAYGIAIAILQHPNYISYFNPIVGGPEHGDEWLLDSNLDWGQDLYRLPGALRDREADAAYLLYSGYVTPRLYGVRSARLPDKPVDGVVVVSVNYLKGMQAAEIDDDGELGFPEGRLRWARALAPTEKIGSLWLFDLRPDRLEAQGAVGYYNRGIVALYRGAPRQSAPMFEKALALRPDFAEAHHYLAAVTPSDQVMTIVDHYRSAIQLAPRWAEPANNLAWILATSRDARVRNGAEAVRLAERACRLTGHRNDAYLDTLAAAYAEAGRFADAERVCERARQRAERDRDLFRAESFEKRARQYRRHEPLRDPPSDAPANDGGNG